MLGTTTPGRLTGNAFRMGFGAMQQPLAAPRRDSRTSEVDMTQVDNSASLTTPELSTAELGELMRSVMDTAERLQSTHDALQGQVARLERELAEANAQLHRSRELASLGEMAAGIAHEIRNPLASIQLFAEVLSEDLVDRPEQKDVCRKIDVSVRRMDAIVSDVLQFARESTVRCQVMPASSLLRGVVG